MTIGELRNRLGNIAPEKEVVIQTQDGNHSVEMILEYPEKVIVLLDDISYDWHGKYSE